MDKLAYVILQYLNLFDFHFKVKIDLQVTMPHSYPYAALQLFGRSSELDRQQQLLLNKGLTSYIGTFDPGELCVCAAIQWLQDNSASYFLNRKLVYEPSTQAKPVKNTFLRMWIDQKLFPVPNLVKTTNNLVISIVFATRVLNIAIQTTKDS